MEPHDRAVMDSFGFIGPGFGVGAGLGEKDAFYGNSAQNGGAVRPANGPAIGWRAAYTQIGVRSGDAG